MHQTKKGNQYYFGAKAHIGVDSKSGIIHSVCTSAASVSDVHMLPDLLHGEEKKVWGDAGYQAWLRRPRTPYRSLHIRESGPCGLVRSGMSGEIAGKEGQLHGFPPATVASHEPPPTYL